MTFGDISPGADWKDLTWDITIPMVPDDGIQQCKLLQVVWNGYKAYSPIKLSNMTHEEGGPWKLTFDKYNGNPPKGTDIPDDLIKSHFKMLISS